MGPFKAKATLGWAPLRKMGGACLAGLAENRAEKGRHRPGNVREVYPAFPSDPRTVPKKPIPYRNGSPHGWWIGSYLERFEFNDEDRSDLNRRCDAYENTVILKARNREEAYRKLVALASVDGSECRSPNGRGGFWRFEGITGLLPIYEELEDGAEILWQHHRNLAVKTVRKLIRAKHELPIFDDSEPLGST